MEIKQWIDTELAMNIWKNKYEYKNEGFDNWIDRVSGGNQKIKQLILDKKFLFGGRILANRGLDKLGKKVTYSNCYVLPAPEDNIESIFDTAKHLARTFSYSGGVGIDISKLRPNGMKVHNAAESTTGSTSFMDLYSKVTEVIGAKGRRGALMLSILCTHPDIMDFIDIKNDLDKVTKANISIRILDDFMNAVKEDKDWELFFDCKDTGERISTTIKAKEIYRKICHNNWNMAEPGALFWDTINNWNILSEDDEFEFAGTNPCAEEPLPAGGSCLLGSINLSEFVKNPFTGKAEFDYISFKYAVEQSVIALNEVLDEGLPLHPLEIQRESVRDWRQIGLGVMAIGDTLIKLGLRYGSEESINLCDRIGFIMADTALKTSAILSRDHGSYPKFKLDAVLSSPYVQANTTFETIKLITECGLRNSQLLTIAPTGSLSTMLGVTGGIEPIYAVSYTRTTKSLHDKDVDYKVYTPIVKNLMEIRNITEEKDLPNSIVTAMTLNYRERIDMQSIWQKHIDASISSTVNVPENFTVEQVEDLYMYAWEKKLKGVTIFRDGCTRLGILKVDKKEETTPKETDELGRGVWKPKAPDTIYYERKVHIGCGKLNLFIGWSDDEKAIQDFYVIRSGQGGCEKNIQASVIAMSGMLRLGGNLFNIEKAFEGIGGCNSFISKRFQGGTLSKGSSCSTAILNEIKMFLKEINAGTKAIDKVIVNNVKKEVDNQSLTKEEKEYLKQHGEIAFSKHFNKCPLCGEELENTGGCLQCVSCGWSKCS